MKEPDKTISRRTFIGTGVATVVGAGLGVAGAAENLSASTDPQKLAQDSGAVVICHREGVVDKVDGHRIIVRVEGEGEGEGEPVVEGEAAEGELAEGEPDEGEGETCGCCNTGSKHLTIPTLFERVLGDWLVIGLSMCALLALAGTKARS